MAVTNKPKIEAYIGASGSGKGVSIAKRLKELAPKRLLIWDPRNEYSAAAEAYVTLSNATRRMQHGGNFALRYVPGDGVDLEAAFHVMCSLAFTAGNIVFLAEELSDVTTASRAPPAWRKLCTQGRHAGVHIIGAAQRPALIDKNFLGNCTYIRCFALRYRQDRATMAQAMDVPEEDITALETTETAGSVSINYLERDFRSKVLQKGNIKLRR